MNKTILQTAGLRLRTTLSIANVRAAVLDWRPILLVMVASLLTLLVAQLPVNYRFRMGIERGPLSDQPFLQSFYGPEGVWPDGMFRWSRSEFASLELPAIGQRTVTLGFTIASHRAQHDLAQAPTLVTLEHDGRVAAPRFALRRAAAHYQVLLPAEALPNGRLQLRFVTPAWQNQGDSRDELGIALAQSIKIASVAGRSLVQPDLELLIGLNIGLLLGWSAIRATGIVSRSAFWLMLPFVIVLPLLSMFDPGRAGFLGPWFIPFGLLFLGSAAAGMVVVPPGLRLVGSVPSRQVLSWLVLIAALVFALKYGGRFYPDAMPGDWQLHINRFGRTVMGDLSIRAQHRGLPFPFPQGYYLDIAPFILSGISIRPILPLLAGLFEAASVPVLYAIMWRATASERMSLTAALIYAGTAHGFMNTWFSFHTQVSTQFFTALLILLLTTTWPNYREARIWWPLSMVLLQQFLGHIGTFINTGLLGAFAILVLWQRAKTLNERRSLTALLLAGMAAFTFAMLGYYSIFTGLIVEQINGVASRGLLEVTGKKAISMATHLQVLWDGGLITHYGFFPVVLAIPGSMYLSRKLRSPILPVLLWGTLLVSAAQGLLPFFTQSAIMTRWLTFAAWAVAVGGAAGGLLWWRRGRAARIAGVAMAGYVLWITLLIYAEAMTQRLPPIEPF